MLLDLFVQLQDAGEDAVVGTLQNNLSSPRFITLSAAQLPVCSSSQRCRAPEARLVAACLGLKLCIELCIKGSFSSSPPPPLVVWLHTKHLSSAPVRN